MVTNSNWSQIAIKNHTYPLKDFTKPLAGCTKRWRSASREGGGRDLVQRVTFASKSSARSTLWKCGEGNCLEGDD